MCVPAIGTRGGILTAWNSNSFSQQNFISRYSLSVTLSSTSSNKTFTLTNIYAPADHSFTDAFLHEMRDLATNIHGAWLLVGDFNLLRCASDKNNHHFNSSLADSFNTCINSLALLELPLLDRLYTWSNKRSSPTLARLDRAFLNTDLSCLFPDCTLTSRIFSTSDHVPLLLTLYTDIPRSTIFRFENAWLKHPPCSSIPLCLPGRLLNIATMLLVPWLPVSKPTGRKRRFGRKNTKPLPPFTITAVS